MTGDLCIANIEELDGDDIDDTAVGDVILSEERDMVLVFGGKLAGSDPIFPGVQPLSLLLTSCLSPSSSLQNMSSSVSMSTSSPKTWASRERRCCCGRSELDSESSRMIESLLWECAFFVHRRDDAFIAVF